MAQIETAQQASEHREQLRDRMHEHMAFQTTAQDTIAYRYVSEALEEFAGRGLRAAQAVERELKKQEQLPDDDKQKMSPDEISAWEAMLTEVEVWTISIPHMLQQARVLQHNPAIKEELLNLFELISQRSTALDAIQNHRFRILKGSNLNTFSPFETEVPQEFYQLAVIATIQWMARQRLREHPDLLHPANKGHLQYHREAMQQLFDWEIEGNWEVGEPQKLDVFLREKFGTAFYGKSISDQQKRDTELQKLFAEGRVKVGGTVEINPQRNLKKGEQVSLLTVFFRATERVGLGLESTRVTTEEQRGDLNAERVTQNLPGAADFAYNIKNSMDVWNTLLTEVGGEPERIRYARQLRESVEKFRADFIQKEALEEFRNEAQESLDAGKDDNARARKLIEFFTWITGEEVSDTVVDRMVTNDAELQKVFDIVMKKMEEGFRSIADSENAVLADELINLLQQKETGGKFDENRLSELLIEYGKMQLKVGRTLVALQAWQIEENVQRVGGRGDNASNLEQLTRIDGRSADQILRSFSPYGALKTTSYRDAEGRIILVDPGPSFSERSWSHIWETGKLGAQHVTLSVTLTHILSRIHYLTAIPGLHGLVKMIAPKFAVGASAVAQGALAQYEAYKVATKERMKRAGQQIFEGIEALQALQENEQHVSVSQQRESARLIGNKIFSELSVLLHATEGEFQENRPDLHIESHVYTNELLTAFGFPPEHGFDPDRISVASVAELEQLMEAEGFDLEDISPEARQYLGSIEHDEALLGHRREMQELQKQRDDLRKSIESDASATEKSAQKKSRNQQIIDGETYPQRMYIRDEVQDLYEAAMSAEMDAHIEGSGSRLGSEQLLSTAVNAVHLQHQMNIEHQSHVRYEVPNDLFIPGDRHIFKWIPGPYQKPVEPDNYRDVVDSDTLKDWDSRLKELVQDVPMVDVLRTARYLRDNGADISNDQLERFFPDANDRALNIIFGSEKSRSGKQMAEIYLGRWVILRRYVQEHLQ